MARSLATAIFVTSIAAHFGLVPYLWLYFTEDRLFRLPPEIWRPVTSFLLSSPKFGIVMDPYFGTGAPSSLFFFFILPGDECCLTVFPNSLPVLEPAGVGKPEISEEGGRPLVPDHGRRLHSCRCISLLSIFFSLERTPSYICPHSACSPNYRGSWKRGRLPSHFGRSLIRNPQGSAGVRAWWDVIWMTRVIPSVRSGGFLLPTFQHQSGGGWISCQT